MEVYKVVHFIDAVKAHVTMAAIKHNEGNTFIFPAERHTMHHAKTVVLLHWQIPQFVSA